jgi:23S rRNA pseudouridine1911/1915/1917 synthase
MQPACFLIGAPDRNKPLGLFLAGALRISRREAKRLLDARCVFVNDQRIWMARHALRMGDRVEVHRAATARPTPAAPRELYRDEHLVIVDKPAGRLSSGPGSVESDLRAATRRRELTAVHRLDRDTTGCLVLAADRATADRMVELFRARAITKIYHALAAGRVPFELREIRGAIDGEPALTRVTVLDANRSASHLRLSIETGRTHQIRRHLASVHHPLLGEKVHATGRVRDAGLRAVPRQMLHAESVSFVHPVTGTPVRARAPLPADFRGYLKALGLR